MVRRSFSLVLSLVLVSPLLAQPLADRVPEGAIVYVGWRGASDMPSAYQQSHLRAVLRESRLPQLMRQSLPKAIAKIAEDDAAASDMLKLVYDILADAWKHPTALYIADVDFDAGDEPVVKMGILCKAGDEAQAVEGRFRALIAEMDGAPAGLIRTFVQDGVAGLVVGYAEGEMAMAGEGAGRPAPLSGAAAFKGALAEVHADPVAVAYVDFERVLGVVDAAVALQGDDEANQVYPVVRDASGLAGLKRSVWTAGFDGQDWMTQCFVELPPDRQALLKLFSDRPVNPELLKAVPASATLLQTAKIDPALFISEVRGIVGAVSPDAQTKFDQGLGVARMYVGRDLMADILEPLGEDWAAYHAPDIAGAHLLGLVVVNRLDDAAKAAQALPMLSIAASNSIAAALKDKPVAIRGRMIRDGDLSIYYVALPLVQPAWTVHGGNLYLGFHPQAVAAAARSAASGRESITSNPAYIAAQKRLGVAGATTVGFSNAPALAGASGYSTAMMIAGLAGFGDLFGIDTPAPLLPPLDRILPHLAPAGSASWMDERGWHRKSVSSFPGSMLLSEAGLSGAAVAPVLAGALLPALTKARESAASAQSMSNLRQIGLACMMHAADHDEALPPDLGALLAGGYLEAESAHVFVSARHGTALPGNWGGMTRDAQAAWINANSDYVYLGAGKSLRDFPRSAEAVLAHEKFERMKQGINVLFADGHVEFVPMGEARRRIREQTR